MKGKVGFHVFWKFFLRKKCKLLDIVLWTAYYDLAYLFCHIFNIEFLFKLSIWLYHLNFIDIPQM